MKVLNASVQTGNTLNLLKDVIVDHWEALVKEVIQNTKHESSIILKDHIPEMIEQLIKILVENKIDEVEMGKSHGFQRAVLTKFSLADLLTEYSLLRETLIDFTYPMGEVESAKLIHKYIDILLKHATIEYLSQETMKMVGPDQKLGSEVREIKNNPVIEIH